MIAASGRVESCPRVPVVVSAPAVEPLDRIGYASTILGRPCWIHNDMRGAVMKRREDCAPFTYTLAEGRNVDAKAQEKFVAGLAKLERAAKRRAPKVKAAPSSKLVTVRMQAGAVLEISGLPRGYSFQVEEV